MKILIVHMRYHPDATGTAPLITQLAEDLVKYGEEVSVIASLPHYGRKDIHPDFQASAGRTDYRFENGVEVIRTRVYLPRNAGLLQRGINYLSYNLNSILEGFKQRGVEAILAVNPPITTSFAAWILRLFHRAPLVIVIQDVWPDCLIEVGTIKNRALIIIGKLLEKIQYNLAKKIIVLSSGMKKNLLKKGVPENKIQIIQNWADPGDVAPVDKENWFYKNQDLAGKFTVLFSGNHGYIAALESVIQAAEILKEEEQIKFILAGEGNVKPDLIFEANQKGLKNIVFLPTQSKETWIEMISAVDIGLVTLKKDLADLNVPSKVYTLMSAACPILASVPDGSEVELLINNANCGLVVAPESPEQLAEGILYLRENSQLLDQYALNGRKYLLEYLGRERRTRQYHQMFVDLISKR